MLASVCACVYEGMYLCDGSVCMCARLCVCVCLDARMCDSGHAWVKKSTCVYVVSVCMYVLLSNCLSVGGDVVQRSKYFFKIGQQFGCLAGC